jgi:hypothetical protein
MACFNSRLPAVIGFVVGAWWRAGLRLRCAGTLGYRFRGMAAVRERLELSRTGLEQAAYRHVDRGPQLRRTRAAAVAAGIVAVHGANLVVEDSDLRAWARRWGRGIHAFTPGTLIAALQRETAAVMAVGGGPGRGLVRAGTRHTAWTQHCLCGARVAKRLSQRRHHCPGCRDLVAALLGAHTTLTDPAVPGPARIDWPTAHTTLHTRGVQAINEGLQGALPESTGTHRPDPPPHGAGLRRPQRSTSHPEPPGTTGRDHAGTTRRTPRTAT